MILFIFREGLLDLEGVQCRLRVQVILVLFHQSLHNLGWEILELRHGYFVEGARDGVFVHLSESEV
jgi:hypothetical protein